MERSPAEEGHEGHPGKAEKYPADPAGGKLLSQKGYRKKHKHHGPQVVYHHCYLGREAVVGVKKHQVVQEGVQKPEEGTLPNIAGNHRPSPNEEDHPEDNRGNQGTGKNGEPGCMVFQGLLEGRCRP